MTSRLFEEIIKLDRELGTEEEEFDLAEGLMTALRSEDNDRPFRGPGDLRVYITRRGYREFLDGVSRVMSGATGEGASDVIRRWDDKLIPQLCASVDLLPDAFRNMRHLRTGENRRPSTKKSDVKDMRYYEAIVFINGQKFRMNMAFFGLRDRPDDLEYYFHTLREGITPNTIFLRSVRFYPI